MVDTLNQTPLERVPQNVRDMIAYRPGKPIEELKQEYGFDKVIKLASNENPFGPSPKALEAVKDVLSDSFRYPDPISRRLRQKLAQRYSISSDDIVVASSSENLIAIAIRTLVQPGDKCVTGAGAFLGMKVHLSAQGGQLVEVPSPNYRFDPQALVEATTPETKILYLPNPNNPTGTYMTQDELRFILDNTPPSTLVILDEAYTEFCNTLPDYPNGLDYRQNNVLVLRTFSKAYGLAGLRIGYAIGSNGFITQMSKTKMTFEPSLAAQVAAEAALDDTAFIEKTVANNTTERQRYETFFTEHNLKAIPSHGNFVMVELPSQQVADSLNQALLEQGIAIRPLAAFGFPHCIRISIGLPKENTALMDALQTLLPKLL